MRVATRPRLTTACRATHASGLHCTLAPGHDGDHVAHVSDVRVVASWPARAITPTEKSTAAANLDGDDDEPGAPGDFPPLRGNGAAENRKFLR